MSTHSNKPGSWRTVASEYGMAFVLLFLVAALSVLTMEKQHPTGVDAGRQVADEVVTTHGTAARVVIIAESTPVDKEFVRGAAEQLKKAGVTIAQTSTGNPRAGREVLELALQNDGRITAVLTTADTSKWTIYDKFEQVGADKCVSPQSYWWPTFARGDNLLSVANQTAIYAIIAIGMTMVIVTAGIDLSVGSLVALASIVTAIVIRESGGKEAGIPAVVLASATGISICAGMGLFNGWMITRFRIPPFIATLAMMMMARGLARKMSAEESISALPESFLWLSDTTAGVPNPVILMLLLYVIAHVVMSNMVFGRHVYAVGGNPEAARLSGVKVKSVTILVYTICGALAGLGGIMQSSKLGAGDPKLGVMLELDVIAAVVVGGTSLMGGEGKIFETLVGAFIIAVIRNGMNLMNVGAPEQQMVLGAVVLVAVLIDMLKHRHGDT